jgi:NarL family two-component system response regulator LiaR
MSNPPIQTAALIRLAVVDGHPLVSAGVAALLDPYRDQVRVETVDGTLPGAGEVDVVLLDSFGRPDAPARVAEVIAATGARVVVFSWAQTRATLDAVVRAGAAGYLPKAADGRGIAEAVATVHAGRQLFSAPAPDDAPGAAWPGQGEGLTPRESQILSLIVSGLANREIAETSWLSPNTVKTYIRTAYRKIGVNTRAQAVQWCLDHGFEPVAASGSTDG